MLIYKVSLLLLHQEVSVENAENVSASEICTVGRQTILSLGTLRLWLSRRTKLGCSLNTHSDIFVHRLHVWRLWPYLFKRDISVLARHAMQQPSGSVKAELQSCGAFSTMVASLALTPDLLAEARHLLHSWFLSVNRYSHQLHFPPTKKINFVTKLQWRPTWYRQSCEAVNPNKSSKV